MAKRHTGHLFKRGKTYYCQWRMNGKAFLKALYDKDNKPITIIREAEAARTTLMASFTTGDEVSALESLSGKLEGRKAELARIEDQQNPPLAIRRAWDAFLAMPNRPDSGESTLTQYQFQFDQFEKWMKKYHTDKLAMRDVSMDIAAEYASYLLKRGLSTITYNKHLNLLAMVFRVLTDKAKLTINHWQNIQRKRMMPQSRRELTTDELIKVCSSAVGDMCLLFAIGVYTGLRLGDCATLRWSEVDLHRRKICRIPNKTARHNSKPVLVPIHPALYEMLNEIAVESRKEFIMPDTATNYLEHPSVLTNRIRKHLENNGIRVHKPDTGSGTRKRAIVEVGFHSFRHSFVSICRNANVPLAVVEAIVGHSNPAMTRHYTHLGEGAAIAAINSLPVIMMNGLDSHPKPALTAATVPSTARHSVTTIGDLAQFKATFQSGLESMMAENWRTKRDELLAMLALSAAS